MQPADSELIIVRFGLEESMNHHFKFLSILAVTFFCVPIAKGAESYDNCTGFIDSVPAVITTQGTWCLRGDLSTSMTNGNAITINANNATVDCNDFKVGGLAAGTGTYAVGIHATNRLNVVVQHCNVRGFLMGVQLVGESGGNYMVAHNRIESSTATGIHVGGDGSVVRDNLVRNTGGTTVYAPFGTGISTYGSIDVLDNTVSGVSGDAGVEGISTVANTNGSISGNRVRGIVQTSVYQAIGIENYSPGRITLRNNDVSGNGTRGITCFDEKARARGNLVNGFDIGLDSCGDAGDNDITPR